jgi:hypothetical protein
MFGVGLLGFLAPPFAWAFAVFAAMVTISVTQALRGAVEAKFLQRARDLSLRRRVESFGLIFVLHLMQPAARLWGRLKHGLTPWRRRQTHPASSPAPSVTTLWSETWRSSGAWLRDVERELQAAGGIVHRGGDYDDWDLCVRGGLLANARLSMAVEDHAAGKQNLRFRTSFNPARPLPILAGSAAILALSSALTGSWPTAGLAIAFLAGLAWQALSDWNAASGGIGAALNGLKSRGPFFASHEDDRESVDRVKATRPIKADAAE